MEPVVGEKNTFRVNDSAFDSAHAEAVCHILRRDPRVVLASHRSDYTEVKISIETVPPAIATQVFAEACNALADEYDSIIRQLSPPTA
jgi:hypothetical protein